MTDLANRRAEYERMKKICPPLPHVEAYVRSLENALWHANRIAQLSVYRAKSECTPDELEELTNRLLDWKKEQDFLLQFDC